MTVSRQAAKVRDVRTRFMSYLSFSRRSDLFQVSVSSFTTKRSLVRIGMHSTHRTCYENTSAVPHCSYLYPLLPEAFRVIFCFDTLHSLRVITIHDLRRLVAASEIRDGASFGVLVANDANRLAHPRNIGLVKFWDMMPARG